MDRLSLQRALDEARDRLDAAYVLDRAPHRAESIRILVRGIRSVETAASQFAERAAAGASPLYVSALPKLKELRERLELAPETDRALTRETRLTKSQARRLALSMLRSLRRAARTPRTIALQRAGWVAAVLALGAAIAFVAQLRDRFDVASSGRYAYDFRSRNVIDGDERSEWLAPDHVEAWLDFNFRQPVDVREVRISNGRNVPYQDRGVKDLDLTLFAGAAIVGHTQVTLPPPEEKSKPVAVPISARGVTRIRFFARTHYGKGASLAEIEVIER